MSATRSPRSPLHLTVLFAAAVLLTAPVHGQIVGNSWDEEGPSPIHFGQTEGITNNPVVGAVNSVAAHPTNADILYIGAVNGGIWRTLDATSANPTWTRLTYRESSQSIGTIEFDPTDGTNNTLLAGVGRFSSFAGVGGSRSGLLRTTDGINFTEIGGVMLGRNIVGVAARGATLVAAVDVADSFTCGNIGVFRSTNTGASWTQTLIGTTDALASDPTNNAVLYASKIFGAGFCGGTNGIYRSSNTGATWVKVSNATMDGLLLDSTGTNVDIAVGASGQVFVSFVSASTGRYSGVFRSPTGLAGSWTQMDLPRIYTLPAGTLHPGQQGGIHTSIAADPSNSNIVYLGGDRQSGSFPSPNPIGATNFTGNLARGDASLSPGSQWTPITHSGTASNSSPHADSRDMAFDADGNLIETDDGGVYKRTNPTSSTGDWFSMNSNLQVTEDHGLAYDSLNDRLLVGNQDTGSAQQTSASGPIWTQISQGDGGDVLSGTRLDGLSEDRYSSFQNLGNFRRQNYLPGDTFNGTTFLGLVGPAIDPQFSTPLAINEIAPARIIIGGDFNSGVHESTDRGATQVLLVDPGGGAVVANSFDGAGAIAAGGAGNAEMLLVAGCLVNTTPACVADGVYRRTGAGGALIYALVTPTGRMTGVTIDPDLASQGFAVATSSVHRTTDSGANWSTITGNLLTLSPGLLRSIEYINSSSGDAIVVGADRGVFIALSSSGFATWSRYGGGLPNSPVFELYYDSAADDLFAGLFGGGAYRLSSVSNVCAESFSLTTGDWKQISMPCNPGGSNTVNDVFGDDLSGTYDVNWVVFERDETNDQYVKLSTTSPLSIADGYWIKTNQASQTVDVSGIDNVQTDHALTGVAAAPTAGCASSAGRCNKAGNPHAYNVCWSDVLVVDGGTPLSLSAADPGGICQTTGGGTCIMSRIAHKWNGSAYETFDGQTPGMEGTLVPWDGFWVSANKPGISLRIPEIPGDPVLPCGPPAAVPGAPAAARSSSSMPDPWFIRLIARSGARVDSSNVFGQAGTSNDKYDAFDLPELDPFGSDYLTIVFPQPNWGPQAGNYSSDYHSFKRKKRPERWRFAVRSSDPGAEVVLRWEGPENVIRGSVLWDLTTRQRILPRPDGSYVFTMTSGTHRFSWRVRGNVLPTRPGLGPRTRSGPGPRTRAGAR